MAFLQTAEPAITAFIVAFSEIFLLILAFKFKASKKILKAAILAVVFATFNYFLSPLGLLGSIIAGLFDLLLAMKMLGFEFFGALLFSLLIGVFNGAIIDLITALPPIIFNFFQYLIQYLVKIAP
jgi:hypothetical protein